MSFAHAFSFSQQDRLQLARAIADHPVLIVPGLRNSDEKHWQSLWQEAIPGSRRIEVVDWTKPNLAAWRAAIKTQLDKLDRKVVLVAHSFGALASASIAAEYPHKIAAIFLVAPADPDKFGIAPDLPREFLPVPTRIIASNNDPWLTETKAAYWALLWGADYFRFKEVGHINSESGLGIWVEGIEQLQQLLRKVKARTQAANLRSNCAA